MRRKNKWREKVRKAEERVKNRDRKGQKKLKAAWQSAFESGLETHWSYLHPGLRGPHPAQRHCYWNPQPCPAEAGWSRSWTRHSSATGSVPARSYSAKRRTSLSKIACRKGKITPFTIEPPHERTGSLPCLQWDTSTDSQTFLWCFWWTGAQTRPYQPRTGAGTVVLWSPPRRDQEPCTLVCTERRVAKWGFSPSHR